MVRVDNISFSYGAESVLEGVSATFAKGEMAGIIGPNGSGKTTLLRCMSGYLTPQSGRVLLGDTDVKALSARALAKRMALVPQSTFIEYDFSVLDIVLMGRHAHVKRMRGTQRADLELAKTALIWVDMWEKHECSALSLSGGEWQRMIIARALAQQSDILLLDEPVSSLDIRHQMEILSLVRTLAQKQGLTAICVLHDLNLAAYFCQKLTLMKQGRVILDGEPEKALNAKTISDVYNVRADVVRDAGRLYIHPHYA